MSVGKLFLILTMALVFSSLVFASSDTDTAQAVLTNASATLTWPSTITSPQSDNVGTGQTFTISLNGQGSDDPESASITVFHTDQEASFWLDFINQETDTTHSSYQGRDADIQTYGQDCNPKGLTKMFNDMFNGFFESIFGPSSDENSSCVTDHGLIVWTCKNFMFTAQDNREDQGGDENNIAAAVYSEAQKAGMCEYGDTLVIMADTADKEGTKPLSWVENMTQKVNQYYGVNAMGAVAPFKFSFMDAGDANGNGPWYDVGNPLSDYPYPNSNRQFGEDAIKAAFDNVSLPQDLYFERVVVVYAGDGHQNDNTSNFANACSWGNDQTYTTVNTADGPRKIYWENIILLSENRQLGGWVHEFGHTMRSIYASPYQPDRVVDRYNYDASVSPDRQYGTSGSWDLMGTGSHFGPNDGDTPTQMASFTKVSAGWLTYKDAALNTNYTLTPLEDMKLGGQVLRVDNPTTTNNKFYLIVEARDSAAAYGAPATGVELYNVRWDNQYNHYIVNIVSPQSGSWASNTSWGTQYQSPTLFSAAPADGSTYIIPPWQLEIVVTSMTSQPFSPTVEIENYTPINMTGVQLTQGRVPVNGSLNPSTTENSNDDLAPEEDLEAYDSNGDHTGINTQTGQFENNIPGAIASGPEDGGEEWIFVPDGTNVTYDISTKRTQEYLEQHPELAGTAVPETYNATAIKFDANGNRYEADLGDGSASAGSSVPLAKLDDPSVQYKPVTIPGYGNDSVCGFLPAVLMLLVVCSIMRRR